MPVFMGSVTCNWLHPKNKKQRQQPGQPSGEAEPMQLGNMSAKPTGPICYRCNQRGHIARDCTHPSGQHPSGGRGLTRGGARGRGRGRGNSGW
jgi:hypothetical protein